MTATTTRRYPSRFEMMRQGFDTDTLKRMEFMRYLYQRGEYVS